MSKPEIVGWGSPNLPDTMYSASGVGLKIRNGAGIGFFTRLANIRALRAINRDAARYGKAAWKERPDGRMTHVPVAGLSETSIAGMLLSETSIQQTGPC